mmetsp:Transcript_19368/g.40548  ORF Transcript_19368/g.40548 Transcript_19368/m.40548 type:complete len:283 (+) Transcript_19368:1180-2028(+)
MSTSVRTSEEGDPFTDFRAMTDLSDSSSAEVAISTSPRSMYSLERFIHSPTLCGFWRSKTRLRRRGRLAVRCSARAMASSTSADAPALSSFAALSPRSISMSSSSSVVFSDFDFDLAFPLPPSSMPSAPSASSSSSSSSLTGAKTPTTTRSASCNSATAEAEASTAERDAVGSGVQSMVSQCLSKVQVVKGRSFSAMFKLLEGRDEEEKTELEEEGEKAGDEDADEEVKGAAAVARATKADAETLRRENADVLGLRRMVKSKACGMAKRMVVLGRFLLPLFL